MSFKTIMLAIVDQHALFRKVLKNYLSENECINIVVHSPDVPDVFEKYKNNDIDVLVIDVFGLGKNVRSILEDIRNTCTSTKILVLSTCTDMSLISDLLNWGIQGYISKMDDPEELLQAIMTVSQGKIYRNRWFTEALYWSKQYTPHSYSGNIIISLTERERKVLQLLWEEKSNKEIASQIFLGVRSIEKIRQDLKEKLGVKSTIGLLKYAIEQKIIG